MKYDIIVVGAGLGGLTVASRLAVLGYKVALFEQHYKAGGYASNFVKDGYEFDASLHGIPGLLDGGNLHHMLQCCQVLERIKPLKYQNAYTVRMGEEEIVIPNDIIEYKHMLMQRFPKESFGIRRFFCDLGHFEEGFRRHILGEKEKARLWHKDDVLFLRWSKKTCYEVMKSYVQDEELIRIFTAFWPNFGLPPKELSAMTFFMTWVSYHYHGKYYIEGGSAKLTEAFLDVLREKQADIYYSAVVKKIIDDGKKACGVFLDSGETYYADWVISNIHPHSSMQLLSPEMVSSKIRSKIRRNKIGCSLSQLYIGLDCQTSQLGLEQEETFVCCGNTHEEDFHKSMANRYEESGYLLTNYCSMDQSIIHDDQGVLTMTFLDDYESWNLEDEEYLLKKENVRIQMLERLYRDYPRLQGHVVVAELATPKTMERMTKNKAGAVYGYRQDVKQTGRRRLKSDIGVEHMSLVGAWVTHGCGYEGTITGAILEASRIHSILKRELIHS